MSFEEPANQPEHISALSGRTIDFGLPPFGYAEQQKWDGYELQDMVGLVLGSPQHAETRRNSLLQSPAILKDAGLFVLSIFMDKGVDDVVPLEVELDFGGVTFGNNNLGGVAEYMLGRKGRSRDYKSRNYFNELLSICRVADATAMAVATAELSGDNTAAIMRYLNVAETILVDAYDDVKRKTHAAMTLAVREVRQDYFQA